MYFDFRCLKELAMKVDHLDLKVRYEASGLTQRAFAKQEGLSANMLSYYLKKARAEHGSSQQLTGRRFQEVIVKPSGPSLITITTQSGVKIEIPF